MNIQVTESLYLARPPPCVMQHVQPLKILNSTNKYTAPPVPVWEKPQEISLNMPHESLFIQENERMHGKNYAATTEKVGSVLVTAKQFIHQQKKVVSLASLMQAQKEQEAARKATMKGEKNDASLDGDNEETV